MDDDDHSDEDEAPHLNHEAAPYALQSQLDQDASTRQEEGTSEQPPSCGGLSKTVPLQSATEQLPSSTIPSLSTTQEDPSSPKGVSNGKSTPSHSYS